MPDAIPTCGWSIKIDNAVTPCGQPAVAVYQVWACPVTEFMHDGKTEPVALVLCREHEPREALHAG